MSQRYRHSPYQGSVVSQLPLLIAGRRATTVPRWEHFSVEIPDWSRGQFLCSAAEGASLSQHGENPTEPPLPLWKRAQIQVLPLIYFEVLSDYLFSPSAQI